ncbi:DUF7344 domain-containing protein [Halorientalis pallida]|uniref:DUF7344 domain-containing protein n=1 Tax=Halorientalis pallida TaxID=2479928 RepID=A0A498L222_9EURY|nr:hypothetical protein [Halorientalis pallida]RXK50176.1 hypothetical protein EAF64_06335 [Halorientalis pallida]
MRRETTARSGPFSDRHRHVLAAVADRDACTVDELAAALADRLDDGRDAAVTRQEVALVHTHLPRLDSAGLIEFDRERGTVRARSDTPEAVDRWYSDHGGGTDRSTGEPTGRDRSATPDQWRDRRRTLRSVLAGCESGDRIPLAVLAVAVAVSEGEDGATDLASVRSTLHHVHLPKLDASGVLDYDPEARTATCRSDESEGTAHLREVTHDGDSPETAERQRPDDDAVWTVAGRTDVRERQRALFDHADESLALVVATPEMVTADCLTHLREAIDRGVAVTVAATDDRTAQSVESALSGISVRAADGERLGPLPGTHGRLGRVVLADRRAALVGSRDGDERAVTVDGTGHDLVTALRDVVGVSDTADSSRRRPEALP